MHPHLNPATLHTYLLELGLALESKGALREAAAIRSAAKQSASLWAGLSTEFLGESLIALQGLSKTTLLSTMERKRLGSVIKELQSALRS